MDGVSSVHTSFYHTFAVKTDGSLWVWGGEQYGQLGDGYNNGLPTGSGGNNYITTPTQVLSSAYPVRKIASNRFTCALLVNGQVRCWGGNDYGELCLGVIDHLFHTNTSNVSYMHNAIDIAVGFKSACAVNTSGEVYCWGNSNLPGQPWDGLPNKIQGISNAVQVVALDNSYCVLQRPGGVVCWGENLNGQLGRGTIGLAGVTYPIAAVQSLPNGVTSISSGVYHACARVADGSVYCWGDNQAGEIGNGTTSGLTSPVTLPYQTVSADITELASGSSVNEKTCAIKAGGSVICWGYYNYTVNPYFPLGPQYLVPTQFVPNGVQGMPSSSVGTTMSCAVKSDNTVNCWGSGYLGNGLNNPANSNVIVSGLTDAIQVGVSQQGYACALRANGMVSCWGNNNFGYLGNGTTSVSPTPVTVILSSGANLTFASAIAVFDSHTCALTVGDGIVYCWGRNSNGQLSHGVSGSSVYYSSAQRYNGVSGIVAIGGNEFATCVETANSSIYCSGAGGFLDNNTSVGSDSAQLEISGSGFIALTKEAGGTFTCGINVLGDLYCWGANSNGQIGDGTTTWRYIHAKTTLVNSVIAAGTGINNNCAIALSSYSNAQSPGVYCWGNGSQGQMGDGTLNATNTTIHPVNNLADFGDFLGEGNNRMSKRTSLANGYAGASWGDNSSCQLDNGCVGSFASTPVTMQHFPQ